MTPHFETKRCSLLVALAFTLLIAPREAHAQRRGFGPDPERAPSVFAYGFRGLTIGIPVGFAAGYLITRDGAWDSEEWKGLAYGTGVGAISGGVVGMGVGFYDLAQSQPGVGMVVLRDTWYGVLFGATIGLIAGAVVLTSSGDWEDLGYGAAWGTVIGAPVGTAVGFIEGPAVRDSAGRPGGSTLGFRFAMQAIRSRRTVDSFDTGARAKTVWVPSITGAF